MGRVRSGWVGFVWVGLGWVGSGWVGFGWVGLAWVGGMMAPDQGGSDWGLGGGGGLLVDGEGPVGESGTSGQGSVVVLTLRPIEGRCSALYISPQVRWWVRLPGGGTSWPGAAGADPGLAWRHTQNRSQNI